MGDLNVTLTAKDIGGQGHEDKYTTKIQGTGRKEQIENFWRERKVKLLETEKHTNFRKMGKRRKR